MINISGTISKAWMAETLGVKFDREYYFNPDIRYIVDSLCNEYAEEHFPDMRLFYSESNLGQIDYWNDKQIQIGGIQPNMILGMLLGAEFIPQLDKDADITPGCLKDVNPDDLPKPESLLKHPLIKLFDEQIHELQTCSENRLCPIPPFFWDISGRAAIHGTMTSAQKFLGENIFMDMINNPQQCMDIMHWIGNAYIVLCRHFSESADLPITEVHVGECSSCMVGPEHIEQFVVPVTSQIGEKLGPIRLHSCGPSTNHLQVFSKIKNLKSIDLGGDTSIKKARQVFGNEMLISISPLPNDMSAETTEPILKWAKNITEDNNGGNLEFIYHLDAGYNIDTIYALTDFVKSLT
ncbi:MAG: hypothetical protein RQ760_14075 [Sedimentisphaerales bacterium]|nr:hypothetical protein [Sedimentisphaerales bacterium]